MARRKKTNNQEEEVLVDVVGQVNTVQDWIEQNSNTVLGVILAVVLVIAGLTYYFNFYKAPRAAEAKELMYQAQLQFEKDSFALALDNPGGGGKGFLDIIDDYSGTPAANLSNYYAGISYLNLGNYDMAIDYLNDYSAKDQLTPSHKFAALGDAYAEKGDNAKALSNYKKAASTATNNFSTPLHLMKLGLFLEKEGNKAEARAKYETIVKEYPQSAQYADAERYLNRLGSN